LICFVVAISAETNSAKHTAVIYNIALFIFLGFDD
jgi:formate/nitrite transporter FocA (FNT family)